MLPCRQVSVVAVGALHALVPLLGFDGEGGDRPRLEAAQRDRLAGFLAVAVRIFLDAPERGVDLGDQLALPVTGPQFRSEEHTSELQSLMRISYAVFCLTN